MRGYLTRHSYLVALGSNVRHHRHGAPQRIIGAALARLAREGLDVHDAGLPIQSHPVGPSQRRYANTVAMACGDLPPPAMLRLLHRIEQDFGRRRRGQPWSPRVLDLDIVLWSGGAWASPGLTIPHPAFRTRPFVLGPARWFAHLWRDPLTGLSLRHLHHRLTRPRPVRR